MSQDKDGRLGTTVGGYRIDSLIGRGGMSVVYLAEDAHLGRRVALKFLAPELAQDTKFQERFTRESRLAASLEHPNIVTVYEAKEAGGQLYLAMRYVPGTDLKRLIEAEGALDPDRTVSILSQAASALDAAHAEGLIHRDVKPGNILITPRTSAEGRDRVYLSDFGLTKRATSDSGITATGQFVGTLDYAAPEQFEAKALDARADVYSLGCVLYECLTGEVPYPRENQAALVYAHLQAPPPRATERKPDLPGAIDQVLARAMAKVPEQRYASAGELVAAAGEAFGVEPVGPTTPIGPVPPTSRRRSVALAAAGAALGVVGLTVGLLLATRGAKPPPTGGPSAAPVDYVARVDPTTGKIAAKIPMGSHPIDVAVGEGSVWVLDADGSVRRVDPVTDKTTVLSKVARDPQAIGAGDGGIWVADGLGGVHVINAASNRVVKTFDTGGFAADVAPGEGAVWVAVFNRTKRVDPSTGVVTDLGAQVSGGPDRNRGAAGQTGYAIAFGSGLVWDLSAGGGEGYQGLSRYEVATGKWRQPQTDVISRAIAVHGDDAWVTVCGTPGMVLRIDVRTEDVLARIPAGGAVCPYAPQAGNPIVIAAGDEGVWVSDGVNGTISKIDQTTDEVASPIKVGETPTAIADGLGSVWVTVDGTESP